MFSMDLFEKYFNNGRLNEMVFLCFSLTSRRFWLALVEAQTRLISAFCELILVTRYFSTTNCGHGCDVKANYI